MITFHFVTLFPETITAYTNVSILKKAQEKSLLKIKTYNLFEYTEMSKNGDLPRRVDDKPYGGGPGMVMRVEPILKVLKKITRLKRKVRIIHFSPSGTQFTNEVASSYADNIATKEIKDIVFICGRYEGIDARIEDMFPGDRVSIGPYVLTGGELPALIMTDAIARQIDGVLGESESIEERRDASSKVYTRPEIIRHKMKTYSVPEVLTSGDHKKIDEWRKNN